MKKDKSILTLIERFAFLIELKKLEVVDFWDADLCAIGLRKKDHLIYISTFNMVENNYGGYDYELEKPDDSDPEKIHVIETRSNVTEEELTTIIHKFLH